jgi:hypothetical protein
MAIPPQSHDPGVHLGPEAEPPPAVAAVEPDPPEALLLGQLADGDLEDLRCFVESHRGRL